MPDAADDARWNHFWTAKLAHLGRTGTFTFSRALKYHAQTVVVAGAAGATEEIRVGQEKGIDVRIAVDLVGLAYRGAYDAAIVFSQDQDLSEAVDEVKLIAKGQSRFIHVCSAFPDGPERKNHRGINGTDWIRIEQAEYDRCLDPRDYRPKRGKR